jgi:TIGR03009 family protein
MQGDAWRGVPLALLVAVALCCVARAADDGQAAPVRKAAPAPAAAQGKVFDPKRMERILVDWGRQSAKLQTLHVRIRRIDDTPGWGKETFEGIAQFKAPNLAWVQFDTAPSKKGDSEKKKGDPEKKGTPHERIVCTGKDVWHYKFPETTVYVFPLNKADRQRALEEGPLPFLFNFRAEEAKRRYRMTLVREDKQSFIIRVDPLLAIDQEEFVTAYIKLDRVYLLPTQIFLFGPERKGTKLFDLTEVKPNDPDVMRDDYFRGARWKDWKVVVNPGQGADPRQGPRVRGRAGQRQPVVGQGAAAARPQ